MTREEAMNHLQTLAAEQGAKIYTEAEAGSYYGHPILVAREKSANDSTNDFGPFNPLGRSRLEVDVQMERRPKTPDEKRQFGICYQQLADISQVLDSEPELIFDTTPALKAEYERKYDLLFHQLGQSEDKAERAMHQAAVEYFKDSPRPKFGFEATNFHVALAKAVAEADGFQHENLPTELLEKYDPYLVTTEKDLSIKEMAEILSGRMLCSERAQRTAYASRRGYEPIYSSDADKLVAMELRDMEEHDPSYIYGFLEWRDNMTYGSEEYTPGESPLSYGALEDLFQRLKRKDLLVGDVPDFANLPYDSLYAASCRIDVNVDAVQKVIREWHRDRVRETDFYDDEKKFSLYDDFVFGLRDLAEQDFTDQLIYENGLPDHEHPDAKYVLLDLANIRNPKQPYEASDLASIVDSKYLDSRYDYTKSICHSIEAMLKKGESYTVRYAFGNAIPFQISRSSDIVHSDSLVLIPARQFARAMEEHPDIKEAIGKNLLPKVDDNNEFLHFWLNTVHEISPEMVSAYLMQELGDLNLSDANKPLLLDTILNYPVETIHKRVSTDLEGSWWPAPFENAVYASRPIAESRPEFQALRKEYEAHRINPRESEILKKLVGSRDDHVEAIHLLHEKTKGLQK